MTTVHVIRTILLVALLASLLGTVTELLLLEHTEDVWQWVPIGLTVLAVLTLLWYAIDRGRRSLGSFRALMAAFVVSGVVGILLHYRGNVEFELEMYPDLSGLKLFKDAMMGATPALAPGTMIQTGLIGLAWAFRHPALLKTENLDPHEERTT